MKTIYVKDKTGFNGAVKEIYEHQYDSRKHTLVGEALKVDDRYFDKRGLAPPVAAFETQPPKVAPAPAPAPSVAAPAPAPAPAAPAAPAPRAAAPRPAAPRKPAPAAPAKPAAPSTGTSSARNDDETAGQYWTREAERNKQQATPAAPAPAPKAAAPKPAAPKPATPSAPLPPPRPKDLDGTDTPKAATPTQRVPEINAPLPAPYGDERKAQPRPEKGSNTAPAGPTDSDSKKEILPDGKTETFGKPNPFAPQQKYNDTVKEILDAQKNKLPSGNIQPLPDTFDRTKPTIDTLPDKLDRSKPKFQNVSANEEVSFSDAELEHIASIMEANPVSPTDSEFNKTARNIGNTDIVSSSVTNAGKVPQRDLTDETIAEDFEYQMARNELATADRAIDRLMKHLKGEGNLEAWVQSKITKASDYLDSVADYMESGKVNEETLDEARGRPPKPGSKAYQAKHGTSGETSDDTAHQGRDPRQHIQVIAGQAAAGRHIDFTHNDGSKSKITPAMGRKITSHLYSLKPAERQSAVNKMHDSAEGLKV